MHSHLLQDLGLCVVSASALSYLARVTKQPLLLAYIAAGVLIGPIGLRLIVEHESIQTLSELGLAFLLFIVGLEIDMKKLVDSGKVASLTTIVQVTGCALLGFATAWLLGYRGLPALYLGAAVAFSSTMIVVKLLADQSELDTVPGHITLGILLVQDALAIVVLAIQPNLGGAPACGSAAATMALSVGKGLGLAGGAVLLSRYVLPRIFRYASTSPEMMLGSAISWCFLVSFAAMQAGFSVAMGALIAGVSISSFPYSLDVVAKIRPLRDFFVTIFLVSLGMLLPIPSASLVVHALVLSLVVVVSRIVTILPVLRLLKFDNRVGILSSLHLAQISEFALVIVLTGISPEFKHVDQDVVSLVVLTLVITSTVSTYLIQFSHKIAGALVKGAAHTILEDQHNRDTRSFKRPFMPILLVGCFRTGSSLVHELRQSSTAFAVIDFSTKVHAELQALGVVCTYGDLSHLDTLEHAGADHGEILISTIPDDFLRGTDNRKLLDSMKRLNPGAKVIVNADSIRRALELYEAGADYVVVPRVLAARRIADVLKHMKAGDLEPLRVAEIEELRSRTEVVA